MHITKLRLLGFKSFVEPTELIIETGLTGVVGPNGCGKSNLLEALRWVMGETSHKSMRAAAMDDVIFSGTTTRPERSSAEVTIFVDNRQRRAPAEFNGSDVIEITRRIEREAGSAYRVNGGDVRARDVKILFEDAATGARSPALVRQGQIGEIVNAKPEARRRILEDAAGVAGLHSRRHEAELRLKAAESNLARLGDILGQLGSQMEGLKRQARQAKRYKELSGEIRRAEALHAHLAWSEAQAAVEVEERNLGEALSRLGRASEAESRLIREEAGLAETLQPLRDEEATRGVILNRYRIEQEAFDKEAERLAERQRELAGRVDQLKRDMEREEALVAEAREILARLDDEAIALGAGDERQSEEEEAARTRLGEIDAALRQAEAQLAEVTRRAFEANARRKSLQSASVERRDQIARYTRELANLEQQHRDIAARAPDVRKLAKTTAAGQQLMQQLAEVEAQALAAEDKVADAAAEARARQEAGAAARLEASALRTELETLAKILVPVRDDAFPPIVDDIKVAPGYETALGAALGDDLDAPAATEAPVHWTRVGAGAADPALPAGVEPLIGKVEAPPELTRRLMQIGIVTPQQGPALQPKLKPGQRLVTREGDVWRWDGFVAAADAPTAAAQRLAERNRLGDIERREREARRTADDMASAERTAAEVLKMAEGEERRLRQLWRDTQAELSRTREQLTIIERQARETETRLAAVEEARRRTQAGLAEANAKLAEADAALATLSEGGGQLEADLAVAETQARNHRASAEAARATLAAIERARTARAERLEAVTAERERWGVRGAGADKQVATLNLRLTEAAAELDRLADLPAQLAARRQKLMNEMADAEKQRRVAADQLAAADNAHRQAASALRAAQGAVAEEREARARIEARLEGARARRTEEARKIQETLGCDPDGCLALAELAPDAAMPPLADVDRQLQRLKADRERLGGVNLQADEELSRLNEQFASMDLERLDLEQAIAKLRGAIGQINREAKKRLAEAFATVDGHFQRLFGTLFSGGEARLEMIESEEDPLEGGLEIIAKPPGKKPATLSLLSGGEQTLTALSLIFAVFLTNPSPICVLDEVDAPLDDSNVDRFCSMMERMAAETQTRFLVITHHPMTMARMHRLFGVTMAEKGVSQLVSVDLQTAQGFVASEVA